MTIQSRTVDYTDGAQTFKAYLAWDDSSDGARPAVLIVHTFAGRGEFECDKARKLAELGYVGMAVDMYGDAKQGSTTEENFALMQPLVDDRVELQKRVTLALDAAREQPEVDASQVAAMGFCFGGLCALDLARTGADIKGAVAFHGLLNAPGNTGDNKISAKILSMHGYSDPMAPPESIIEFGTEMTNAGADWQLHAYGNTVHAFTNPEANDADFGTVYNEAADRRSWTSLQNFLTEIFA